MRLIDADALKEDINNAFLRCLDMQYVKDIIDNAPTIDDLSEYSDKLWKKAYERGKAEARPQGVNCSHCDYFKFSKSFIENVVKVMTDYNIETVEDLMKELNHINEWLGGRE